MKPGQLERLLPAAACTAFLMTACANEPTGPSPVSQAPSSVQVGPYSFLFPIKWGWLGAGPSGNCMADQLNHEVLSGRWQLHEIRVTRRDDAFISLEFNSSFEDDVGFLPTTYAGRVVDGRTIEAAFAPHGPFFNPYGNSQRCYDHWVWIDGQLQATIDADGSIAGTVLDTFRHPPSGGVFTVKTSFETIP